MHRRISIRLNELIVHAKVSFDAVSASEKSHAGEDMRTPKTRTIGVAYGKCHMLTWVPGLPA